MKKSLLRLWKEDVAQDLIEYALLLLLVGLGAVSALRGAGLKVANAYSGAATTITVNGGGNGGGDNGGGKGDGNGGKGDGNGGKGDGNGGKGDGNGGKG
jgi:Flp pilus assembly pilin Flp